MYLPAHIIGILSLSQLTRQTIHSLRKVETIGNDTWNGIANTSYTVSYFDDEDKEVASTSFRVAVGQIGWIYTKYHSYDNPLRAEILYSIASKMMAYKNPPKTIWEAVASKDDIMYQRLGFTWSKPAHYTVTGEGWSHNLTDLFYKKHREL